MSSTTTGTDWGMLRHVVATIAYRGGKALRDAPADFATFAIGGKTRTPIQILAHIGDLLEWTLRLAHGQREWKPAAPLPWPAETDRFFASLKALDDFLASGAPLDFPAEKIFQGPLADALTHVGQIAMLRRLAGSPVRGKVMIGADVVPGRVGPDQSPPSREFD
ncbi:MAG: hypothetical protein ABR961_16155 [Thermoanaerobaculaceae bacterium]